MKTPNVDFFSEVCPKCGQKMNPCSFRYLVKRVKTAKDLLPSQKTCPIKKESTNIKEIGSKNDEIEESASDFSFLIGYSNYIKNGTFEKNENCCREEPMTMDTEASLTVLSIKFWQKVNRSWEKWPSESKHMTTTRGNLSMLSSLSCQMKTN